MNTCSIAVDGKEYLLRLTVGGQKALKKKYPNDNTLDLLLSAAADMTVLADVLDEALRWQGNNNPKDITGERLVDKMVDAGFAGQLPFCRLSLDVAETSGLIDGDQREKIYKKMSDAVNGIFEDETPSPGSPVIH